jgi:hypothetical protein
VRQTNDRHRSETGGAGREGDDVEVHDMRDTTRPDRRTGGRTHAIPSRHLSRPISFPG